jgi:site-specific DNA-cytosine methylase
VAGTVGEDEAAQAPAPAAPRFLTPRECARLQGFPDGFVIPRALDAPLGGGGGGGGGGAAVAASARPTAAYRLLGNAVSPPVASAIGAQVLAVGGAFISTLPARVFV